MNVTSITCDSVCTHVTHTHTHRFWFRAGRLRAWAPRRGARLRDHASNVGSRKRTHTGNTAHEQQSRTRASAHDNADAFLRTVVHEIGLCVDVVDAVDHHVRPHVVADAHTHTSSQRQQSYAAHPCAFPSSSSARSRSNSATRVCTSHAALVQHASVTLDWRTDTGRTRKRAQCASSTQRPMCSVTHVRDASKRTFGIPTSSRVATALRFSDDRVT
jgi:hypothetical protein